jgi:transposase
MAWTVAIGVDTHKDLLVAGACDQLGAQLDSCTVEPDQEGFSRLLLWAQQLGRPAFAVEGCGSYGAGLADFLAVAGIAVFECERPRRRERRRGKSDLIDAALAARRLVSGEGLSLPRGGGLARERLRLLLLERRGVVEARTAALNQLHAAVLTPALPERLRRLDSRRLIEACLRLRATTIERTVVRRLAGRIRDLEAELAALDGQLAELVAGRAPQLLRECGVGPVCAAQLLVSSGEPARMRSEAAFAAFAGTSPVDASSGRQHRHRLNRGGDRQLNRALHVIALNRTRYHEKTRAYYERLLATGKTTREARRCVKRALARYFYRQLLALEPLTP